MNKPSRRDRLLALFAASDKRRADELQRVASPGVVGLVDELNRPSKERELFLSNDGDLPAITQVLDAIDDSDEGILGASKLVERLRWISNHRDLMKANDPHESIASATVTSLAIGQMIDTLLEIESLLAARPWLKPREVARVDKIVERLRGSSLHLWARGHDSSKVGTRGDADNIGRWRALLIREIDALVPSAITSRTNRFAVIAELLTAAGIETSRQNVRGALSYRRP